MVGCISASVRPGFLSRFFSDANYVKHENVCVPVLPESIPAGACHSNQGWYLGPSGYRLKAGNTCNKQRGVIKDAPVRKDCARPQLPEGEIGHTVFQFPKEVIQFEYLGESEVITSQIPFDVSVYQVVRAIDYPCSSARWVRMAIP